MKFLVTNDDGIDAPGIEALFNAAITLGEPIVVAPLNAVSGCSHKVTTDGPIRVEQRGNNRFAIDGTPADCVRIALYRLAPDTNWVLSGINSGGNLGADVWHSGTVAAVREAVLHGWPGIALSQYRRRGVPVDWTVATKWTTPVIQDLLHRPRNRGTIWNINLPHLDAADGNPEVVFCPLDPTPLPLSFRGDADAFYYNGDYHLRRKERGADVDVCFSGRIAVAEITLF